jgi:hypothetical protein
MAGGIEVPDSQFRLLFHEHHLEIHLFVHGKFGEVRYGLFESAIVLR